jgi:hypothetical protein
LQISQCRKAPKWLFFDYLSTKSFFLSTQKILNS